jgi:hypothetical protein
VSDRLCVAQGSRDTAGKVPCRDGGGRPIFCVRSNRATAFATLIRQRRLTPSCGGHAPTAERTVGPARMIVESLTPRPGIREHNGPQLTSSDARFMSVVDTVDGSSTRHVSATNLGAVKAPAIRRRYPCKRLRQWHKNYAILEGTAADVQSFSRSGTGRRRSGHVLVRRKYLIDK